MIPLLANLPDWIWLVPVLPLVAVVINAARVLLGTATGDAAEPLTARCLRWPLSAGWCCCSPSILWH